MSSLTVTNTFSTGVIQAAQFNTNYSDIVTYINNRNSGSATWDGMYILHATNVPLTANNSTGTQDIAQFKDNGTLVGEIFNGGIISFQSQDFLFATELDQIHSWSGEILFPGNATTKIGPASSGNTSTTQTQSSFSVSTFKFTCASPGKYLVIASLRLYGTSNPIVTMKIYVNGSSVSSRTGKSGTTAVGGKTNSVIDVLNLLANDYIEFYVTNGSANQSSISNLFFGGGFGGSGLYVSKLA